LLQKGESETCHKIIQEDKSQQRISFDYSHRLSLKANKPTSLNKTPTNQQSTTGSVCNIHNRTGETQMKLSHVWKEGLDAGWITTE
jgi:hypothetical protein